MHMMLATETPITGLEIQQIGKYKTTSVYLCTPFVAPHQRPHIPRPGLNMRIITYTHSTDYITSMAPTTLPEASPSTGEPQPEILLHWVVTNNDIDPAPLTLDNEPAPAPAPPNMSHVPSPQPLLDHYSSVPSLQPS